MCTFMLENFVNIATYLIHDTYVYVLCLFAHICAVKVIPLRLSQFEALLKSSTTPWLAGTEEPSIADFLIGVAYSARVI